MLRYALFALAWGAVGDISLYAAATAQSRLRAGKVVQRLEVEAADSSAQGHLVSAARVRSWIAEQGIATVGTAVDAVDLDAIERTVLRSGFVERAVAYVTYDGVLRVEIGRRDPLLRFALDGYDAYATEGAMCSPCPALRRSTCPWSRAPTDLPSRRRMPGGAEPTSRPARPRSSAASPNWRPRSTPSTGASGRTTATSPRCAACASSGAGGGARERGVRSPRRGAAGPQGCAAAPLPLRSPPRGGGIEAVAQRQEAQRREQKVGQKLRRFPETPYLCEVRRGGRFLEVGGGADHRANDLQRSVGGGSGAPQRGVARSASGGSRIRSASSPNSCASIAAD